ncbi:MAG TPA: hypothetical protein VHD37_01455 [Candidatus Paceibacterota bacterium]|nr:hypothetical protein [Candidatus Paceibacterota bacterium]
MVKLLLQIRLDGSDEHPEIDLGTLSKEIKWAVAARIGELCLLEAQKPDEKVVFVEARVKEVIHDFGPGNIELSFEMTAEDYLLFALDNSWYKEELKSYSVFPAQMKGVHLPS